MIFLLWLVAWLLATKLFAVEWVAKDAGRIADATELTNALTAYYLDYNRYPIEWAGSIDESFGLVPSYLGKLPKDPNKNALLDDFENIATKAWYYAFLADWQNKRWTMMVMTKIDTPQKANYVSKWSILNSKTLDRDWLKNDICSGWVVIDENYTGWTIDNCITNDSSQLRYIFVKHNE